MTATDDPGGVGAAMAAPADRQHARRRRRQGHALIDWHALALKGGGNTI
jgi:hypothetical protein